MDDDNSILPPPKRPDWRGSGQGLAAVRNFDLACAVDRRDARASVLRLCRQTRDHASAQQKAASIDCRCFDARNSFRVRWSLERGLKPATRGTACSQPAGDCHSTTGHD